MNTWTLGKSLQVTPDIEILSNNRIAAIADTKYKEIDADDHPPSERSTSNLKSTLKKC